LPENARIKMVEPLNDLSSQLINGHAVAFATSTIFLPCQSGRSFATSE
jgi:hypothetical protein